MRAWRVLSVVAAFVATASAVPATPPTRSSAEPPVPVLLELFTSEGCSSCPPADQLLRELVRTKVAGGAQIHALSEHVDYWNQLGWTDPFSSKQFSDRQTAYGRALGDEVYTPQMVVDGRLTAVGSSREEVLAAIRKAAVKPKVVQVNLSWRTDLEITVAPNPAAAGAEVYLAITEDGLTSNVRRGENEGHQLSYDAVTRRLTRIGATSRQGSFSQTVPIAPMLDPTWRRDALQVIVFLQTKSCVVAMAMEKLTTSR